MTSGIQSQPWYLSAFEQLEKRQNGDAQSRMYQIRRSAFESFKNLGFPTTQHEEWRFTNISAITKTEFQLPSSASLPVLTKEDILQFIPKNQEVHLLVFLNGFYQKKLSHIRALGKGMTVEPLSAVLSRNELELDRRFQSDESYRNNPFDAINTAFIQDGAVIRLDDGVISEIPVYCLFLASGSDVPFTSTTRNLINVGKNSRLTITEHFAGLGNNCYLTNSITDVILSQDAVVEFTKLQAESEEAYHIDTLNVNQAGKSTFTGHTISLGGAIVRNNVRTKFEGEYGECTLNGLSLAMHEQLIDNHTAIDHAMPNCASHELYKSILGGKARGVFNGKIFVRKDAQKTDAKQTNKTLLLSESATINTKPQLEIFADDVKCTHGATVGQLDANQIFYLRSRGFGLDSAKDVLTTAFANDIIDRITETETRERCSEMMFQRLHEGRSRIDQ